MILAGAKERNRFRAFEKKELDEKKRAEREFKPMPSGNVWKAFL